MLTDNPAPQRNMRAARAYAQLPRFQRVKISVLGRYMLADRREFPCQVLEMSPGDAVVIAPVSGNAGEKVIAYLDHLGRVEGAITEAIDGGFVMDGERLSALIEQAVASVFPGGSHTGQ